MLKILIADDHEILRRSLRQILLEEYPSSHIEEVEDGYQLLKKALADTWDLIISDISMPAMSGLEAFLRQIRRHFPVYCLFSF